MEQNGCDGTLLPGYRKVSGTFKDRYSFQTLCFPTYELKHCTVNIVILGFMYVFVCESDQFSLDIVTLA